MSYADQSRIFSFDIKTADMAGAIANDTDLFSILIPAGREVEVQGMYAHVRAASDGADFIELVKEDNTVICKVPLQNTGKVEAVDGSGADISFPQRVAPQSSSALSLLKLRSDGATDATTDATIQVHISGLGHA